MKMADEGEHRTWSHSRATTSVGKKGNIETCRLIYTGHTSVSAQYYIIHLLRDVQYDSTLCIGEIQQCQLCIKDWILKERIMFSSDLNTGCLRGHLELFAVFVGYWLRCPCTLWAPFLYQLNMLFGSTLWLLYLDIFSVILWDCFCPWVRMLKEWVIMHNFYASVLVIIMRPSVFVCVVALLCGHECVLVPWNTHVQLCVCFLSSSFRTLAHLRSRGLSLRHRSNIWGQYQPLLLSPTITFLFTLFFLLHLHTCPFSLTFIHFQTPEIIQILWHQELNLPFVISLSLLVCLFLSSSIAPKITFFLSHLPLSLPLPSPLIL